MVAIPQKLRKQVNSGFGSRGLIIRKIYQIAKTNDFIILELGELSTREILLNCNNVTLACTIQYILSLPIAAAAIWNNLPIIAFDDGDTPSEKLFVFEIFEISIYYKR